jgi:hypothetical protein
LVYLILRLQREARELADLERDGASPR